MFFTLGFADNLNTVTTLAQLIKPHRGTHTKFESEPLHCEASIRLESAFLTLSLIQPQLKYLFELVIDCVWCSRCVHWKTQDMLEFFVSELAHKLLFLDVYKHGRYTTVEGLDILEKTIHKLVVLSEILAFRNSVTGHPSSTRLYPDSTTLIQNANQCIESIKSQPRWRELTTQRAQIIIDECASIAAKSLRAGSHQRGASWEQSPPLRLLAL